MNTPPLMTIANYAEDGIFLESHEADISLLDAEHVNYFANKVTQLSGDLDLPLDDRLPGEFESLEYRIASTPFGGFTIYYLNDTAIMASLMLSGEDEEQENELIDVFRFLLIDTEEDEEPSDEQIDAVLSSTTFDFAAIENRPAVYQISFSNLPEEASELAHAAKMDQHLAAAFFGFEFQD